jgi:flagellin-like protein
MNIELPDTDDRGQVGIGTLIIFIALVLVSAVAAGVLIDTSGQLESRASDTGEDAQAQVSNQIDVVSATAETDGSSQVDSVTLVIKKSPGSDPIDLEEATIQYTAGSSSATLTDNSSEVSITDLSDSAVSGDAAVLDDNGERLKIKITLGGGSLNKLDEGDTAELEIVDQSGASTVYGVNVPDVISDTYVQV